MSDQKDKTSEIKIFFDKNEIFAKLKKCGLKRQHVYKVVKILRKGRPLYRRIENQRTRSARTPTKIKLGYAKNQILAFKVALQLSILQPSIARLICRKWGFSANKKRKVAGLTQANKAMRLEKSRHFLDRYEKQTFS